MLSLLLTLAALWLIWRLCRRTNGTVANIPGPSKLSQALDLIMNRVDTQGMHKQLSALANQYGPITKVDNFDGPAVIVSNFDLIHKVLVSNGKEFGNRDTPYRFQCVYENTGIIFNHNPDTTWKMLRTVAQRHFKQYAGGLTRLEDAITTVTEQSMFSKFAAEVNIPFDPLETLQKTAVGTLIHLMCGNIDENRLNRIFELFAQCLAIGRECHPCIPAMKYLLLDAFPWLRHISPGLTSKMDKLIELRNEMWAIIKDAHRAYPENDSILKTFDENNSKITEENAPSENDIKVTFFSVLVAGMVTTSDSFHNFINILSHNKHIQEALFADIAKTTNGGPIRLNHRQDMHYTRATILEFLRITSVVALGVGHETAIDTKLLVFDIPKGTRIITNLWHLHHDPKYWNNPEEFQPERFLDENRQLVPPDHENRRHLMPFGAGLRVCVGESFALARIFLWLTTLIQRYEILPAPGNEPSSASPDNTVYDGIVHAKPFQIILKERM